MSGELSRNKKIEVPSDKTSDFIKQFVLFLNNNEPKLVEKADPIKEPKKMGVPNRDSCHTVSCSVCILQKKTKKIENRKV